MAKSKDGQPAETGKTAAKKPAGKKPAVKAAGEGEVAAGAKPAAPAQAAVPRLKQLYHDEIVPKLRKEFGIENVMAVPRLEKINVNIGMGEASRNIKLLDDAQAELAAITGQQPAITRAKKSIAAFKLREGMPIGCRVTLRGDRMWEFLDRLVNAALPRVRDFRGVSAKSFDGRGNYTLGIRDHLIFPEVDGNRVTLTDPNGNQTWFSFDLSSRLIEERTAANSPIQYTYNARDLITQVTNGRDQNRVYAYETVKVPPSSKIFHTQKH
ncbi:MAG: 50S ribosomal protein L5 [Candidatus Competibacteraceae bacterium]|nr:50S ribosomal protein L5 [Candidatus Competibacteraceae bacterium]